MLTGFLAIGFSIAVLIFLIVKLELPAFFSLLMVSLMCGLLLGMAPAELMAAIQNGMGGTLGFIAVVVGLGAMLGALLERAGGIAALSDALLRTTGDRHAPWALALMGVLVAIPVFFDVGFIIFVPVILGLAHKTGRSSLYYALPLLAGLAAAHAFIPPTPGPIAVAEILGADLGWVIVMGLAAAIPATLVGGPLLAKLAFSEPASEDTRQRQTTNIAAPIEPGVQTLSALGALAAMLIPLVLIVSATLARFMEVSGGLNDVLQLIGHPFSALLITLSILYTGLRMSGGLAPKVLNTAMAKSLEPAAAVILVTGAGGAFKQVLVDSGIGAEIAAAAASAALGPLIFGFLTAAIVRIMQGSATVAMITGAGLTAPLLSGAQVSDPYTALSVIAIASGATVLSHVNDSGFWLVSRYLDLTPAQTFRSWTVSTTLVGCTGFTSVLLLAAVFG